MIIIDNNNNNNNNGSPNLGQNTIYFIIINKKENMQNCGLYCLS